MSGADSNVLDSPASVPDLTWNSAHSAAAAAAEVGALSEPTARDSAVMSVGLEPAAVNALEASLGYTFTDLDLLTLALSHRGWCAEVGLPQSNERLEFLGDAVLGMVVTDRLYRMYPEMAEGELARVRSGLVNSLTLAEIARTAGVGDALLLGKGENSSGGRDKTSILADAMEAIFGAIYLDSGASAADAVIVRLLRPHVDDAVRGAQGDPKSRLQETAVRQLGTEPTYAVSESGPDHGRSYVAFVEIGDKRWGPGHGSSKKEAEQRSATMALADLAELMEGINGSNDRNGGTKW